MAAAGYDLHYYKGFTGRAQPIILLLEDAEVSYNYVEKDIFDAEGNFIKSKDYHNKTDPYCSHAFPQFEKGSFVLSQTTAIMQFLGEVHNYDGETPEEKAHVLQVALNAADVWTEAYESRVGNAKIGLETDNGKTFWKSTEGKPSRGSLWLQRLEANVKGTEGDFLFGRTKVTYADFCVFNVMLAVREMYGAHFEEEYDKCPDLKRFEDAMKARPAVRAHLEKNIPILYPAATSETLPFF